MASTSIVDPFNTADVFGNNLDDFDIWDDHDEDFNPNSSSGSMKEFHSDFFSEQTSETATTTSATVSSSEQSSNQEGTACTSSPEKSHRRTRTSSRRRVPAKRPSSLRQKLGKSEPKADENDKESSTNGRSINSKSSNNDDSKSTSHHETESSSHSPGREKSERKGRRGSKSPSRRGRPSSHKKEVSMRNLVTLLNKSNPEIQAEQAQEEGPIVSKSIRHKGDSTARTRPKSMRDMRGVQSSGHARPDGTENDYLPSNNGLLSHNGSDKLDHKAEPVRGKLQKTNSLKVRKARLTAAGGDQPDGLMPTRGGDPTRTRPTRTKSMNQRVDGVPLPRPTLPERGLPGKSASFAIRRERSGDAATDGDPRSTLAAMAAAQARQRGEGRPGMPPSFLGRGLAGRRSASFAIRKDNAGMALDGVMKSKLAAMKSASTSQGEQTEENAATGPREPSRGNLRPSLSGRGLAGRRSASFAIRKDRAGMALDGVMKSKLAAMKSASTSQGEQTEENAVSGPREPSRGNLRPSLSGRGLAGRRSASFAIRKDHAGMALDGVMKSKLAAMMSTSTSQREQTEENGATDPREPTRGNLGRSASNDGGHRLPPSSSRSGKGLQRVSRGTEGHSSLQRTSSTRF